MSAHSLWLPCLVQCLQRQDMAVRVVIAAVRGSAPREAGASMIVSAAGAHGTIGGGRLEWEALEQARGLLEARRPQVRLCKFVLGPELGQCCGGVVELWLELHTRADLPWLQQAWAQGRSAPLELRSTAAGTVQHSLRSSARQRGHAVPHAQLESDATGAMTLVQWLERAPLLYLYGAGHVGRAVLRIAAELPWQVTCIDSRAELLEAARCEQIEMRHAPEPVATVAEAPPGSHFLVMTHSHALDYALVRAILSREAAWVGLIGSHSKSARFRAQLRRDGLAAAEVERLVCPIGVGLRAKQPMAIAVSVVAQLLQHLQAGDGERAAARADAAAEPCAQRCENCTLPEVPS